jgi:RHS repeat-associated protein
MTSKLAETVRWLFRGATGRSAAVAVLTVSVGGFVAVFGLVGVASARPAGASVTPLAVVRLHLRLGGVPRQLGRVSEGESASSRRREADTGSRGPQGGRRERADTQPGGLGVLRLGRRVRGRPFRTRWQRPPARPRLKHVSMVPRWRLSAAQRARVLARARALARRSGAVRVRARGAGAAVRHSHAIAGRSDGGRAAVEHAFTASSGDPNSQLVLPTESYVYTQETDQSPFVAINFQLIAPDTGQWACPQETCSVGQESSFGAFPAGTGLEFAFAGYLWGTEYWSGDVDTTGWRDNADEYTIGFMGASVNVWILSVPPTGTLGSPSGGIQNYPQCETSQPVNCATGNFTHTFTDLAVPGRGMPLDLNRTYNSLAASTEGMFGYGWTSSYEMSLSFDSSGDVTVHQEEGAQTTFNPNGYPGSSGYSAPPNVLGSLVQNSDATYTLTRRGQQQFVFSSSGQLLLERDPNGYTTTLSYNPAGQLVSVTDPAGRSLTYAYGGNGLVSSVTDPAGRVMRYGYDGAGNLTSVTDPDGGQTTFGYDSNHLLTSMSDARDDGTLTNTYNDSGQVTQQQDEAGRTTSFAYAPDQTTITDPDGNVTVESYVAGVLASITKGSGTSSAETWSYGYDMTFGVSSITDPNGHLWTASYDANGNQISTQDPDGNTTSAVYNGFDEPTSTTDANGETTTYAYDSTGNLQSASRPVTINGQPQTQTTSYGHADGNPGDITSITDPDGHAWTYTYDADGDLTSATDPTGDQTTYSDTCTGTTAQGCYSGIGWLFSTISPRGNVAGGDPSAYQTTYAYNGLGEPTSTTDARGKTTSSGYDAAGNLTQSTDPDGNQTTYAYDPDNELTQTTQPGQITTSTTYGGDGEILTQTSGNGKTTTYTYTPLGQLASAKNPLSNTTSYSYDPAGNLATLTDPEGRITTYGYDPANRLTSVSYSDGTTHGVGYSYYANGQIKTMTDQTGTSSYTYNAVDQLTGETNGSGQQMSYGYDLAGNTTSIGYPNGQTVTQAFDNDERLSTVTDWAANQTTFGYDRDSNLTSITYPAATNETDSFSYDPTDLETAAQFDQGSSTLASLSYTRDANGQVSSEAQTGLPGAASTSYTYTPLNQLATAGTNNYSYDDAGNPTQLDGTSGYQYNDASQLTSSPTATYTYDSLGERTNTTPTTGPATTYSYDQAQNLTSVTPTGGSATSYTYNGTGELQSETTGSQTSQLAWDDASSLPLLLSDGTNSYIYGPADLPVEQIDASGNPTYLHHDQLGSTRLLTNSTGDSTATFTYTPYGQLQANTGTATTPLGYAGQYTDPTTGLQNDRARWYDSSTGQFLTPDPLDELTGHPYVYADDSPVNLSDPSGADPAEEVFGPSDGPGGVPTGDVGGEYDGGDYNGVQPGEPVPSSAADSASSEPTANDPDSRESEESCDLFATEDAGPSLSQLRSEFNGVRSRYWKNEAASNPGQYSAADLARMEQGKAPIGNDGYPMELHHDPPLSQGGNNDPENLVPMTRTEHRLGGNYGLNH